MNMGSLAGCTLSCWQQWPVVSRNEVLLVCVSVSGCSCAMPVPGVLLLSHSRCFPTAAAGGEPGSGMLLPWDLRLGRGARSQVALCMPGCGGVPPF